MLSFQLLNVAWLTFSHDSFVTVIDDVIRVLFLNPVRCTKASRGEGYPVVLNNRQRLTY